MTLCVRSKQPRMVKITIYNWLQSFHHYWIGIWHLLIANYVFLFDWDEKVQLCIALACHYHTIRRDNAWWSSQNCHCLTRMQTIKNILCTTSSLLQIGWNPFLDCCNWLSRFPETISSLLPLGRLFKVVLTRFPFVTDDLPSSRIGEDSWEGVEFPEQLSFTMLWSPITRVSNLELSKRIEYLPVFAGELGRKPAAIFLRTIDVTFMGYFWIYLNCIGELVTKVINGRVIWIESETGKNFYNGIGDNYLHLAHLTHCFTHF